MIVNIKEWHYGLLCRWSFLYSNTFLFFCQDKNLNIQLPFKVDQLLSPTDQTFLCFFFFVKHHCSLVVFGKNCQISCKHGQLHDVEIFFKKSWELDWISLLKHVIFFKLQNTRTWAATSTYIFGSNNGDLIFFSHFNKERPSWRAGVERLPRILQS